MAAEETPDIDYDEGRHTPLAPGVAGGVVAFVAGYLLTYATASDAAGSAVVQEVVVDLPADPAVWKVVTWVFYNAHLVPTNVVVPGSGVVSESFMGAASPALYGVTPALLAAAGYVAADRAPVSGPTAALKPGVSVWPGYFALSVVLALLGRAGTVRVFAGPDPVLAVAVAGTVYPAVFGPAGAVVWSLRADYSS
jgi:hypothetical protein